MKKIITVLVLFGTLFISGCSSKVEKVEGIVFSQTKGGETIYAKGQTVYMFEAGNREADKIFDQLRYKIDFQGSQKSLGTNSTTLDFINQSMDLLDKSIAVDSILGAANTFNTIDIYQTITDDKGNFVFKNIPSGDYYIFVSNLWSYYNYYCDDNLYTGEVKYKKITINKNVDRIIL